ncbi:MAG TPA: hypothetical protein VK139_08070, partial [Microbacteriaceae bacterium]|nr:hypothetical protein [Microbacteriaceae bacterium]
GGVKVNLGEIERFATDTARASGAACALVPSANGVPDLVLLVENVATDDMRALAQALGERFGALTPKVLLTVPSIPRNGAGKIDRAGVAELTRTALENGTAQSR